MSAVVCGGKRSSFFEGLQSSPTPISKRFRCSSSSSSSQSHLNLLSRSSLLDHLAALFPDMDQQFLERALGDCGDDVNSAIRSLNELHLGSAENAASTSGRSGIEQDANVPFTTPGMATTNGEVALTVDSSAPSQNPPSDGAEWLELFIREITCASNMDDARARASRALEFLEQSIRANTTAEVVQSFQQQCIKLKEQQEEMTHENSILKRALCVQHEREKELGENKSREVLQLKKMVSQYQEQLRNLECDELISSTTMLWGCT